MITSSLHIDFILKFVSGEEFSLTLVGRLNFAASSLNADAALIRLLQVLLPPFISDLQHLNLYGKCKFDFQDYAELGG